MNLPKIRFAAHAVNQIKKNQFMEASLPEGANRVQEFLRSKDSKLNVELLPDNTATAQNAADALNVKLNQIGKSIAFGNNYETVVALVSGDRRINVDLLLAQLESSEIYLLKPDEVKRKTGFAIGGVSPFALPSNINVFIDERLCSLSKFYVAAGHPKAVVSVQKRDIVGLAGAKICSISF